MLYRITWTCPNSASGHGEYCLSLAHAEAWIAKLKREYPNMNHWVELESVSA